MTVKQTNHTTLTNDQATSKIPNRDKCARGVLHHRLMSLSRSRYRKFFIIIIIITIIIIIIINYYYYYYFLLFFFCIEIGREIRVRATS